MVLSSEPSVNIFCAYAPEDQQFYQELVAHLHLLSARGLCTLKHAGDIPAGSAWEHELLSLIDQAGLVLVLLSPDYFLSVFSVNEVLQDLLARKMEQKHLIPLLLRPCAWQDSRFGIFAPLPRDGLPINRKAQRDAAWLAIVEELRAHIIQLATGMAPDKAGLRLTEGNIGIWGVPYQRNPFFTGRAELLATLHERLQAGRVSGQTQMLAISGLGGMGKTQIALEYVYHYRRDYSAILWVTAETPETLLADFTRLVGSFTFSAHLEQEPGELLTFVKDWLSRHQDWLLIFDNAETVEMVRDYLPAGFSNGQILLTTRATAGGGLAEIVSIEEMRGLDGARLLLRRAGLLAAEAPLDQASKQVRQDASRIVSELDGLPLGIDQAGAYIAETGCSLAHYLRLFQQCRAQLLARRGALPPGHPEPVATTWKLSFRRIEQTAAADLLRLCAFFSPNHIPEAIFLQGAPVPGLRLARFATDPLAFDTALAELRTYSLVKRNADSDTISLHRLVQAVVRDALTSAQQRTWAKRAVHALGKAIPEPEITHWRAWQLYLPQLVAGAQLVDEYHLVSEEAGRLLNQAGTMLRHAARYAEAEKMYERALHIFEQILAVDHPDTATALDNLATLLGIQRKYEQAVQRYEQALSIRERVLGPEHPETASTINGLALLYGNWRRYEIAQPLYERALSIREQVLGPTHPNTATTLDNLAMLYRLQNNYEQAEPLFKRALQIRENSFGPEHALTASTLNNLAVLYRLQGHYAQAKPLFERALHIREQILGPEHPATATALSNLAYLARLQGQHEQSLLLYKQALSLREQAFGAEHPNATITWLNIGELYQEMGANEQAEEAMRRALLTHEQALGSEHPRVINILGVYIRLLHASGKNEEATRFEERIQATRKR